MKISQIPTPVETQLNLTVKSPLVGQFSNQIFTIPPRYAWKGGRAAERGSNWDSEPQLVRGTHSYIINKRL